MSYIRGKYANAACDLIDYLSGQGVPAQVGYDSRRQRGTLIVICDARHRDKIPPEWQGMRTTFQAKTD